MATKTPGKSPVPGVASMPDPVEDRLLRAIIEAPKDDAARLAYASWLEEAGNPRGRFIRSQVQARSKKASLAQKRKARELARELLDAHWDSWAAPCLSREGSTLERGFFTRLEWDTSKPHGDSDVAFLASSPLFALLPLRRHAEPGPAFSILARLPRLGCFKKLDWSGMAADEDDEDSDKAPLGRIFLGSPHLAGLEELRLANCGLRDEALAALARNPAASSLANLCIGGDGTSEMAGNLFGSKGVCELAHSPYLRQLEKLDVSETPGVGDKGVLALIEAGETLPALKNLDILGTDLSDAGALHMAHSPGLARIERLRIGRWAYQDTPLGDPACRALLESPHLDRVKQLVLRLDMEPDTSRALRKRFGRRVVLGG